MIKIKPGFARIFLRNMDEETKKTAFHTMKEVRGEYNKMYNYNAQYATNKANNNKQNVAFAKEQYSNIKNSFQSKKKS